MESHGYYVLKQHTPWFDDGYSKLFNQGEQSKLQWLQDPSQIYGDNLNNERPEGSRSFRNKKTEYLKEVIHTAEPLVLVPEPSHFEVEIAIAKLNKYKSSGTGQIPAKLIQAGGETLHSEIYKRINSSWNKEELP
jgi:hypothetical protein